MPSAEKPAKRVLVCTEVLNRAAYMRLLVPLEELAALCEISLEYVPERLLSPPMLAATDVLVLQNSSSAITLNAVDTAHVLGASVVYDYCDDLLALPPKLPVLGEYYQDPMVRRVIGDLLAAVDTVTCGPQTCGSLDALESEATVSGWALPDPPSGIQRTESPDPMIGVLTDPTQLSALKRLIPELIALVEQRDNLSIHIVGATREELGGEGDFILSRPAVDFREHLALLVGTPWWFAVAPADTELGLTSNDYVDADYAYCGIPGLYSCRPGLDERLEASGAGVVMNDPREWTEQMAEMLDDPRLRESMGSAARASLAENFGVAALADTWRKILLL